MKPRNKMYWKKRKKIIGRVNGKVYRWFCCFYWLEMYLKNCAKSIGFMILRREQGEKMQHIER